MAIGKVLRRVLQGGRLRGLLSVGEEGFGTNARCLGVFFDGGRVRSRGLGDHGDVPLLKVRRILGLDSDDLQPHVS